MQGERKGNKKRKFFKMPFPNRSRLYVKAKGFSFFMLSRSLLYVKVLRESALLLPRWGDKAGWLGNPGCRLATLGFALGCVLLPLRGAA